jgi:hypothetical protein
MHSLVSHDVFEVDRPPDIPVIKGKWVLKIMRDAAGDVERYKARFCAKRFVQQLHVHYEDVWAPTAQYATLRLLFALSIERSLTTRHVDVKCAFLNGSLNEQLFVEKPAILNGGNPQHVWRLKKAIYGLRQAGRQWHMYLKDVMTELNFRRAGYDPALFISADSEQFVLMWVDDLFIVGQLNACDKFTTAALQHFESRDLGEA